MGTHSIRCEGRQRVTECRQEERTQVIQSLARKGYGSLRQAVWLLSTSSTPVLVSIFRSGRFWGKYSGLGFSLHSLFPDVTLKVTLCSLTNYLLTPEDAHSSGTGSERRKLSLRCCILIRRSAGTLGAGKASAELLGQLFDFSPAPTSLLSLFLFPGELVYSLYHLTEVQASNYVHLAQ